MENRILEHLKKYKEITSWEAIKEYGCTWLSHYIWLLRKQFKIDDEWVHTTNRFGDKIQYKRYLWREEC